MPCSKKIGATWAKTLRKPLNFVILKFIKYGNVLLALLSVQTYKNTSPKIIFSQHLIRITWILLLATIYFLQATFNSNFINKERIKWINNKLNWSDLTDRRGENRNRRWRQDHQERRFDQNRTPLWVRKGIFPAVEEWVVARKTRLKACWKFTGILDSG